MSESVIESGLNTVAAIAAVVDPKDAGTIATVATIAASAVKPAEDIAAQFGALVDSHTATVTRLNALETMFADVLTWLHANFGRGATVQLPPEKVG
jgi:hypothetical protein